MERIRSTRSGLFAIELLIAVAVFTFCAAISIGLFVQAEVISQESADLNNAINAGRSASEIFKAAGGDLAETAKLMEDYQLADPELDGDRLILYYNSSWQSVSHSDTYRLELVRSPSEAVPSAEVSVYGKDGERLTGWLVAALEHVYESGGVG